MVDIATRVASPSCLHKSLRNPKEFFHPVSSNHPLSRSLKLSLLTFPPSPSSLPTILLSSRALHPLPSLPRLFCATTNSQPRASSTKRHSNFLHGEIKARPFLLPPLLLLPWKKLFNEEIKVGGPCSRRIEFQWKSRMGHVGRKRRC